MALLNDDALETGENVYKIPSERSERADFFKYLRWKHTILLKSQYIHCWLITACRYNMSMTVFVTLVICSLETRNLRKMISSEPKCLYFCVGKMFYIPTRNSRKSYYKWLRASQFLCVSETCDSSHTGGVQGPTVGPLAGCRDKAPAGGPGGGAPGSSRVFSK